MKQILIIEDEPGIAIGLEDDLKLEGYAEEIATDGETGSRRAREQAFDLIVLDIMLPKKDGLEVCRELRRNGIRTPILMLTARAQEAEKVVGLEVGADDYVTKPFGVRELRARIMALLRRSSEPKQDDRYHFGAVEVDFARGDLQREGRRIDVTPIELKLLQTFIRSRGRVL